MGKLGLAGTSLIAAVPSGFLGYLLVLAVMNQTAMAAMPMPFKITLFSLLALCALLVLFPLYLVIWYRGIRSAVAVSRPAKGAAADEHDTEVGMVEDLVGSEFVDEEEPVEDWADSGEVGEITESMRLDEVEEEGENFQATTADFTMDDEMSFDEPSGSSQGDETLEFSSTEEDDLFGETLDEFSAVESEEEEFTPAGDLDDEFSFDDFDLDDEDDKKK